MSEGPAGGTPPPPPPPPGFGEPYATPRGPVTPEPEPYYVAPAAPAYVPSVQPPAAPARGSSLGSRSAIVAVIVGLLGAAGGYAFVNRVFFDRDPPTPEQVAAAFAPVPGTTYQEPPPEAMTALRAIVSQQPDADDLISHLDARSMLVGQQTVAVVLIFSVDPDAMTGDYKEGYLAGFRASSGRELTTVSIQGTETYRGDVPLGKLYTFLDPDGLVFLVAGPDAALLERTVGILAAANS